MTTELKTFRFNKVVLQRIKGICKRYGDLSYHVNEALREYIDKFDTEAPKPVVKKSKAVMVADYDADKVIDYLNAHAGTRYQYTDTNRKLINARLKNYTLHNVFDVIEKKCTEWKGSSMEKYLRPSTLFNATKFEEYLNQNIIGDGNGQDQRGKPRKSTPQQRAAEQGEAIRARIASLSQDDGVLGVDG